MDWSGLHTLVAVLSAIAAGISAAFSWRLASALDRLRVEIIKGRSEDKDEMRAWINGSFMRSAVVQAKLDALHSEIEHA